MTFLSEATQQTLASMPDDAERDRLYEEAEQRHAHYRSTLGRGAGLRAQLDALTAELPSADERRRKAIHAERAKLTTELAFLPDDAAEAARRFAHALGAWSHYTHNQALGIHNRTVAELNDKLVELPTQVDPSDLSGLDAGERQAVADNQAAMRAPLAPLYQRRDKASQWMGACNLSLRFGDRSRFGTIDAGELDRFVEGARKAAA